MATPRVIIDPTHPAAMTPEQRRAELATILAAGVIRHFEQRHRAAVARSNTAAGRRATHVVSPLSTI
ncbi:MAG: hypothetical protein ACKVS9_12490 [Phycisphaerae bacterium]